jgi:4'-phosphopantetheinyl transferase
MAHLAERSVHVWRANLGGLSHAFVTDEERARASRFVSDVDRERWICARGTLRVLLGRYLEMDPGRVRFEVGPKGKPSVPESEVSFNLSHSGDLGLFAFARGRSVGVDVERAGRGVDVIAVAERVLGHGEAARLSGLSEPVREREFLRSWVRHEAALKCRGGRLGEPVELEGLSLVDVEVGPLAAAAVAVEGVLDDCTVSEFEAVG